MKKSIGIVIATGLLPLSGCAAPTPTPTPTATSPAPAEVTKDVVYIRPLQSDVPVQKLDVYAPTKPGPWPVVVFAHGLGGNREYFRELSRAIAEQGAVVFTPDWNTWIPDLAARDDGKGFREMTEALTCAIRFARAMASDHGGDPARVTLAGFSLGAALGAPVGLAGDDLDLL